MLMLLFIRILSLRSEIHYKIHTDTHSLSFFKQEMLDIIYESFIFLYETQSIPLSPGHLLKPYP